jgi:hypothetical protein
VAPVKVPEVFIQPVVELSAVAFSQRSLVCANDIKENNIKTSVHKATLPEVLFSIGRFID